MAAIEALELALLGFGLWSLLEIISGNESSFLDLMIFLVITEGLLLGSWVIYNVYIRIARAGGRTVDRPPH